MKMTIFKKTFMILLFSFVLMNVVNVYLDYRYTKNEFISSLDDANLRKQGMALSYEMSQNHDLLDSQDFQKKIIDFCKEESAKTSHLFDVLVVDQNYQMLYQGKQKDHMLMFKRDIYQENIDVYNDDAYVVDFQQYNISSKTIEQLDSQIIEQLHQDQSVYVQYKIDKENLVFLKIGNSVLIGKDTNEQVIQSELMTYHSQNVYYEKERQRMGDTSYYISYQQVYQDICQMAKNKSFDFIDLVNDINIRELYGYDNTFEEHDSIYHYYQIPLLKEGISYNMENTYNRDDFVGYLLLCCYETNFSSSLIQNVINNNIFIFISSLTIVLIICFIVSYMYSKRIKTIEQQTKKIANQEFDIQLSEKSNDELGSLSKSINSMSRQLKQTIEDLNQEIERVKKLEKVKNEFLINFTHEIKTPLSIIDGYIELIHETEDENQQKEYLLAIEQETQKINDLVLAMLNLSRLESGKVVLKIEDVNIDEIMTSSLDSLMTLIHKKNLNIHIDGKEVYMKVDVFEFGIVIKNIMSNAIKHTPEGGNIEICYDSQYISIENEGKHLTTQQMKTIWETYVSHDREGTGLGLAICRTILELHHFDYGVKNTEKGVCFYIRTKE